jgi:tetratricopeptide (TPR) repeat protein
VRSPKPLALLLIVLASSVFTVHGQGVRQGDGGQAASRVVSAQDLQQLSDRVAEIRRDQLNYQVERDLLKEAYASNLQTVQLVLTMILGAFTILGYLGLRSIGALRSQFQSELDQMRVLKSALETQLRDVQVEQSRTDVQMAVLAKENADQDRRLRGLEMRERAAKLFAEGNYSLALEYVIVGLEISPNDANMLSLKATCLSALGRITEAISVHKEILRVMPDDGFAIVNLLEALLLAGRHDEFEELMSTRTDVVKSHSRLLGWFFSALKLLLSKDLSGLTEHMLTLSSMISAEISRKMGWSFRDARVALASRSDLPGLHLFFTAMNVLEGQEPLVALMAQLPAETSTE